MGRMSRLKSIGADFSAAAAGVLDAPSAAINAQISFQCERPIGNAKVKPSPVPMSDENVPPSHSSFLCLRVNLR
jgi:hypothetical protein